MGRSPVKAEDIERIRRLLSRAVAARCPRWLAEERDDLVQKALVRILKLSPDRAGDGGFSASYLNRVAFTVIADEVNKRRQLPSYPLDVLPNGEPAASGKGPDRNQLNKELGSALRDCLQRLHPARRLASMLMLLGYKNREIAELMKWKAKQAENLVTRGRADLKRCLQEKGIKP